MERTEVTLHCQSCGREFTLSQFEYDHMLASDITRPIFCCNSCSLHGWDPMQVAFAHFRHEEAEKRK